MTKRGVLFAVTLVLSATVMTGCMPEMTIEDMKKMMEVERPAELDRLNFLLGTWEGTGEGQFAGLEEPVKMTGRGTGKWECGGYAMVSHGTMSMGELGETEYMEIWTYDAKAGKYRTFWVDGMGRTGVGTAKYNEKKDTWTSRATSRGPHGKMYGKGNMTMTGETSMHWTWKESVMMGLMEVSSMHGTSKKVE